MRPTWVIEANVRGLPSEDLQASIHRLGMDFQVVKPFLHADPPGDILGSKEIPHDACVLFTGTLTLMRYIRTHRNWIPGGWCNFDKLACRAYYAHFGPHLLNRNYVMLPISEALRREDWLFRSVGQRNQVFVRPDSVDKSFAGKLVDRNEFGTYLSEANLAPESLVVVAEPKEIGREWRLFVAHSKVATGSLYRMSGETHLAPELPEEIVAFAQEVLASVAWRPDPLFVMDVCEAGGQLSVVELNSYSCSGHCKSDLDVYVTTASEFATKLW